MNFGKRIRARRRALELSQEALARRADVSMSLINQIERGLVTDPHFSTLVGISTALGTSVSDLMGEGTHPKVEAPSEEDPFDDPRASDVRRIKYLRMLSSLALRNVARWESRLEKGGEEENPLEFVGWAVEVLEACTDFAQLVMEHLSFGPFERLPREEAEARQYLNRMIEEMFRISDKVSKQVVVEIEHIRSGRVTTGKKREARETERRFQEIIRSYEEAKEAAPSRR